MQTIKKSFKCNSPEDYKLLANFLYSLGFKMGGRKTAQEAIEDYPSMGRSDYCEVNFVNKTFDGYGRVNGYACSTFGEFVDYVMEGLKVKPIEVKLNEELKAVITKNEITVGCQKFSHEVIEKLVKFCEEARNGVKLESHKDAVLKLADKSEIPVAIKTLYALGFSNNGKTVEDAIKYAETYCGGRYKAVLASLCTMDIDNTDASSLRSDREYFNTLGTFIDYIMEAKKVKPVKCGLNKGYIAIITKDSIAVGNHKFTHEVIAELGRVCLTVKA